MLLTALADSPGASGEAIASTVEAHESGQPLPAFLSGLPDLIVSATAGSLCPLMRCKTSGVDVVFSSLEIKKQQLLNKCALSLFCSR